MLFFLLSICLIHRPPVTEHKRVEESFSSLTLATGIFFPSKRAFWLLLSIPLAQGLGFSLPNNADSLFSALKENTFWTIWLLKGKPHNFLVHYFSRSGNSWDRKRECKPVGSFLTLLYNFGNNQPGAQFPYREKGRGKEERRVDSTPSSSVYSQGHLELAPHLSKF